MCPPLTNDTWVYGGDDDTLFRLITLGSDELQKAGYVRKGRETGYWADAAVRGNDQEFGRPVQDLAFVRSKYSADADQKYKFGTPPEEQ